MALVPRQTYRFRPRALLGTLTVGGYPEVQYDPAFEPWDTAPGLLVLPRYYPTLIQLNRDAIAMTTGGCGPIPGSSIIALGGPPAVSPEGDEFWECLPSSATQWSCPFRPPINLISLPHQGYLSGQSTEEFSLHPSGNPPSSRLDSYPRAMQLSTGHIFIANDIDTDESQSMGPPPNNPGESWGLALQSIAFSNQTDSRLWRGPTDSVERQYGTAVLMHTRNGGQLVRDRVLVFGGKSGTTVTNSVEELDLGSSTPDPVSTANRRPKTSMLEPRMDCNAVILPTGQILIVGGSRKPHAQIDLTAPVVQPELYDAGPGPAVMGSTTLLAQSNVVPAIDPQYSNSTPRMYHSVATLLPDGRVFVGGGESSSQFTPQIYPDGKYTCEVFSPPYFQLAGFHKPVFTAAPSGPFHTNNVGAASNTFTIEVLTASSGTTIDKVVLLRPGSVTHHFDYSQRYIELEVQSDTDHGSGQHTLVVAGPEYTLAPLGWYMLFVVELDSQDSVGRIPSSAEFIRFDQ
jgi:hypothetical protein